MKASLCREQTKGNSKKNPFKVAEYKEKYEATQEVLQDDQGEMMDEEDYIGHCATRSKNRLSHVQAQAEWQQMVANPKKHYSDKKGPNGSYRFRISLRDLVTFRSAVKHARGLEMGQGPLKNFKPEQLAKMKHTVAHGIAGSSFDGGDLNDLARAMVASGSSVMRDDGNFEGSLMTGGLSGLRSMMDEASNDDESETLHDDGASSKKQRKDNGEESGAEASSKAASSKAAGKKKAEADEITISNEIAKSQRVWRKACQSLTDYFQALEPAAGELLVECQKHAESIHIKNALAMCSLRTKFAKACLGDSAAALEALIQEVATNAPPDSGGSMAVVALHAASLTAATEAPPASRKSGSRLRDLRAPSGM